VSTVEPATRDALRRAQELIMNASEDGDLDQRRAPMLEALIAAEPVSPYPPGVPLFVPGQRVHDGHVEFLRKGLDAGMFVEGASDPSLEQLRVVA
jgi:arginine decarboxylase